MADIQHRVTDLETEIKVLKNEIKAILLDIREQYLNAENPFNVAAQAKGSTDQRAANVGIHNPGSTESATPEETIPADTPQPPLIMEPVAKEKAPANVEWHGKKGVSRPGNTVPLPSLKPGTDEEESPPEIAEYGNKDTAALPPNLEPSREPWLELSMEEDESLPMAKEHSKKATSRKRPGQAPNYRSYEENGNGINLITIAGLSKWVDESTEKIGKERTEVMVEACHMVGHLSLELRDLLIKLVHLAQVEQSRKIKITTKDYLGVIAQLDSLLGYSNESEAALLTILTDGKESNNG